MSYILENKNEEGCVFCLALEDVDGHENLVVYRGESAYVILNRYPYTSGHLMVVPLIHCANLDELPTETKEILSRVKIKEDILSALIHSCWPDSQWFRVIKICRMSHK